MTLGKNLWNTIAIVIVLNSLYEDFDIITTSLLQTGNKTIDQIQTILQSKEAKTFSKQTTGATGNLAMAFHKRNCDGKRKANTNNKCYNCHKLGHPSQDCPLPNKRLNRIQHSFRDSGLRSRSQRPKNRNNNRSWVHNWSNLQMPNKAHQIAENDNDSKPKPFKPEPVGITFIVKDQ